MAQRKATSADEETGVDSLWNEQDLSGALEKVAAEMGVANPANVLVYQIQADGSEGRIWGGDPSDYDLNKLAKQFGSGQYLVRLYIMGESGRYSLRGSKVFTMILTPAEDARIAAIREGRNPDGGATSSGDIAAAITRALDAQQEKFSATLRTMQDSMNNRAGMIQELKGLAEVMGIARPAIAAGQSNDPMQMFTMFAKFAGIMKELQPAVPLKEDEIGGNSLLMKAIEVFQDVIRQKQGLSAEMPELPQNGQLTPYPVNPPVTLPAEHTPQQMTDETDEDMLMMRVQLKMMIASAAKDTPVDSWADVIYENAPDELLEKLTLQDWFAQLLEIEPKCQPYQPWFTKVRDAVLSFIAEDLQREPVDTQTK